MNKTQQRFYFPNILTHRSLPVCVRNAHSSEVREAAGIFFVFIRNDEERLLKFVIVEFLKRDGCCDGGENGDVCERESERHKSPFVFFHLTLTYTGLQRKVDTHTEFDGKARGKFHLNKLSQFAEVLERGNDLQHVQQPGDRAAISQQFSTVIVLFC